jgi:hypothetical protein
MAGLAVDGTDVYWAALNAPTSTSILKAPLAGGAISTLATGQYGGSGLTVDATHVYWVNNNPNGSIVRSNLDGSALTTLVTAQNGPAAIAVDATSVYWATTAGGTIMKATPK